MKTRLLKFTSTCLFTLLSPYVKSAPVTITFQSTLQFDSTLIVAAGGQTVGDIFDAIYGVGTGASEQIGLSGSLTYEDSTPVFQQVVVSNDNAEGNFLAPITGLQLTIGGASVTANIASINANNDLSLLGIGLDEASAFPESCLDYIADCEADHPGLSITRTSNAAQLSNSMPSTGNARDTIVFGLGLTGIENNFSSAFNTGSLGLGNVFVDGFYLILQSNPNTQLWDDHTTLPDTNLAFDVSNFDIAEVGVIFNGDNISDFSTAGMLSTVPVPSAIWLFGSGIIGLAGLARRRSYN